MLPSLALLQALLHHYFEAKSKRGDRLRCNALVKLSSALRLSRNDRLK